jgi:hypothetical protein
MLGRTVDFPCQATIRGLHKKFLNTKAAKVAKFNPILGYAQHLESLKLPSTLLIVLRGSDQVCAASTNTANITSLSCVSKQNLMTK